MAEKVNKGQKITQDEFSYQITVFKDNDELIVRIFKEDGEIKGIVKDGYLVDIKKTCE